MGKTLVAVGIVIGFAIIIFSVVHTSPTKGPVEMFTFDFDVPTRDNHIIAVKATTTYSVRDTNIVINPDEVEDRVYSNVTTAFRAATTGVPFEKLQGIQGETKIEDEVSKIITYFNGSPYDVVKIVDLEFSLTFDPPAEFEEDLILNEGLHEEGVIVQPRDLSRERMERRIQI